MVKRSPHGTDATSSGVLRGLAKTCAPSEWLEQSINPTSSAQAAEAESKHAPKRIRNRLRDIAPSSARGHTEPSTPLSGLETSASNWPEGQVFPKRQRQKRQGVGLLQVYPGLIGKQ